MGKWKSQCETLKCPYSDRDAHTGEPVCNDPHSYVNEQGESVCGRRDDAIPVRQAPCPQCAELLKALKGLLDASDKAIFHVSTSFNRVDAPGFFNIVSASEKARAAIAKAEGE